VLPENVVDSLDGVRNLFESDDPVLRHEWLFVPHPEPFMDSDLSVEQIGQNLHDARVSAVRAVLDAGGLDAILRLARRAESPETAGMTLAVVSADAHLPAILPALLDSTEDCLCRFARGFAADRHCAEGWSWIDDLGINTCQPSAIAKLLSALPFEPAAWERA
jgi:hypothetical protein